MIPRGIPIPVASIHETMPSLSVRGPLSMICRDTGMRVKTESPMSPLSTRPTQMLYCTASGRSRLSCFSSTARVSALVP